MPANSRLIAAFDLPLALVTGWLLWRSRDWPLAGDATIFHFIAGQMKMGAVPYRDIVDVNMPLTYAIHAAVVAVGGMSDTAWRLFDVIAAAVLSILILMLVAPAGRAVAVLAAVVVLLMHLLLGPYAAGQRDFLMSIPAVAVALVSARAAEEPDRRFIYLRVAGALAMTAACIKPTGMLLLLLPAFATRLRAREIISMVAGAAAVALAVFGTLAARGGLGAFVKMFYELLPFYAAMGAGTALETLKAVQWMGPVAGLALAAVLSLQYFPIRSGSPWPGMSPPSTTWTGATDMDARNKSRQPRVRVMIGLTAFGLVHLLVQRKGWSYHLYPMAIGLACWGAWELAALSRWRVVACLSVIAASLAWLVPNSSYHVKDDPSLQAAAAMQSALESYLQPGARVQTLDADNGAFLAMARAGMRQATPHIQWFSLLVGEHPPREDFLQRLAADPPAALLLTNAQWPLSYGFEAVDDWPEFHGFLASHYELKLTGEEQYISWRFYLRAR